MRYFLKNIGTARDKGSENLIRDFEKFGSCFWEKQSKIWFSNSNFGGKISEGDIIIQYIPCSHEREKFAGRVVGVYRVISSYIPLKNEQWNGYRNVENLCVEFSKKSKERTILHIKQAISPIPKAIQCGCAEISSEKAEAVINEIMKRN